MPLRDAEGKVTRYIGTIIDITERKKIETDLIESRKRLNLALEAARAGVWEWDLKTNEVHLVRRNMVAVRHGKG